MVKKRNHQHIDKSTNEDNQRDSRKKMKHNSEIIHDPPSDHEESENDLDNGLMDQNEELVDSHNFETGIITRIHMEEFMCHRKFTVDLGQRVNFITGQNGSGKSAIVAAIQLCLGAKARTTGRGSSLGNLIREGSEGPAIIRVTLLNEGDDAYRNDVYGNRITVERRIKKGGIGSYNILNHNGGIVSKDKSELDGILHNFNIFVDNPCCVLTQEESKKFIQGLEKDKYEFFLKATGLERTLEEIALTGKTIQDTDIKQKKSQDLLKSKQAEVATLKKELQSLVALDEYDNKINECRVKLIWLPVFKLVDVIEEINTQISTSKKTLKRVSNQLTEFEQHKVIDDIDSYERELEQVQNEYDTVCIEIQKLQNSYLDSVRVSNVVVADIRELTKSKTGFTNRLKDVRREIRELRDKSLKNVEEGNKKFIEAIKKCDSQQEGLQSQESQVREERAQAFQQHGQYQQSVQQLQQQLRSSQHTLHQLQSERTSYTQSNNRAAAFGKAVPRIIEDMKSTRFRAPVYGPVGMLVKIKEERAGESNGMAVEKCLGGKLSSFLVSNMEDRNTLSSILKKHGAQFSNSVDLFTERPRYTVPTFGGDVVTIASLIAVDNDAVFNHLVDQCGIEKVAVVRDEEECDQKLVEKRAGKEYLRYGISAVITRAGTTIRYRNGNRASEPSRDYRRLLTADVTEILSLLDSQIEKESQAVTELQSQLHGQSGEAQRASRNLQSLDTRHQSLTSQLEKLKRQRRELENSLAEAEQAVDTYSTETLVGEETDLTDAIEDLDRQLKTKEEEGQELKKLVSQRQNEKRNGEGRKATLLTRCQKAESELQNFIRHQEESKAEGERIRKAVAAATTEVQQREEILQAQTRLREEAEVDARAKTEEVIADWDGQSPRIGSNETQAYLEKRIRSFAEQLEIKRRQAGLAGRTKAIVSDALESSTKDFEEFLRDWKIVSENLRTLKEDYDARLKKWTRMLKSSALRVSILFDRYMQEKGHSGHIEFNHEAKLLTILTKTDNSDATSQCNDVRQLSGGERSFTTLCLLLALGHVIESPFRIMDEYDVFLDQMTRQITLRQLQDYALAPEQKGRQFIIVTPQDLSNIVTSNDVRIRRMPRPQRQSAHGLAQTTID